MLSEAERDGRDETTSDGSMQDLYIDGSWRPTPERFDVTNPWDGSRLGAVAVATPEDVHSAIDAAAAALAEPFAAYSRSAVLRSAVTLLRERAEDVADMLCAEAGKPISAARAEVSRAFDTLDISADEARGIEGKTIPMDAVQSGDGLIGFEMQSPLGVVAAITPFNFPVNLAVHKLGPAIAAGCSVVWKPSERTPLTAGMLVQIFHDAGLPKGMLNLVTGRPAEIVPILLEDDRVKLVNFTGSETVGWDLKTRSPHKRHVLELGANTAVFVSRHADLETVVADIIPGAFGFAGQACISVQRIYVEASAAEAFVARLKDAVESLAVGDPRREDTVVGPLISPEAVARVMRGIDEARAGGAGVLTGGVAEGSVIAPTVLTDVPERCSVISDEVFGPVISVNRVDGFDDALGKINDSRFGLNVAIYTQDLGEALTFAGRAEAGSVMVNVSPSYRADHMPYGGVKSSGEGREGVPYAVREMTETKLVVLRT